MFKIIVVMQMQLYAVASSHRCRPCGYSRYRKYLPSAGNQQHQPPANGTFLSQQISTSHQPQPAEQLYLQSANQERAPRKQSIQTLHDNTATIKMTLLADMQTLVPYGQQTVYADMLL